jgi:phosphatidylinositol alpha-1,6-mannosyltransferase
VPYEELPAHYCAGDVFAMPCRTRLGGLDVEGLGIVFLEASACGLPVVAGRSGGAPDAVVDGETGYVVDGASVDVMMRCLGGLLLDRSGCLALGNRGRDWVEQAWGWTYAAATLGSLTTYRPGSQ